MDFQDIPDEQIHIPLLWLWERQTLDEQNSGSTNHENGIGFNALDAPFASSLISYYQRTGNLTTKQRQAARKMLAKYKGQLSELSGLESADWGGGSFLPSPSSSSPQRTRPVPKQDREVSLINITNSDKVWFQIHFPYSREDVSRVRTLQGRRFRKEGKFWICPASLNSYESLKEWGFSISQDVEDWKESMMPGEIGEIHVPGLDDILRPYQKEGIAGIEKRNGRALIGDEPGLGKTIQSLGWLLLHPEIQRVVVVVPNHLKLNWVAECRKWMDNPSLQVLYGRKPEIELDKRIIIINYEILTYWVDTLKKYSPQLVITDECHYYKNSKAKRTKAVKKLAKGVPHFLALSGTPIVNRPIELYNAVKSVNPNLFPSFWDYARKYCGAKHNGFGWDFNGATNTKELHDILSSTVMIRRLKQDVLKDLPAKSRIVVPLEIENRSEYSFAESNFITWLKENKGEEKARAAANAEALAQIEALKQLTVKGKLTSCIEWIRDFVDSGEKLVVFCTHQKTVDVLREEFGDISVRCDGRDSVEQKNQAVERFQGVEGVKLFVGNIRAAGTGITLTAASTTVFLELGWSPGDHDQAEDRVHRIGQEAESVNAYYLVAEHTIETEIAALIDKKRAVLAQVLDGKDVEDSSLLSELMERYREG